MPSLIIAAVPMTAVIVVAAVVLLLIALIVGRLVSQHRTARRVRKVEESRLAGTLPADVAHALEQASRRSASRRPVD